MKIKYRIIDKLKQYEIIRYVYLFIKNLNNDDFKNYIFNRNNFIEMRQYGNENKNKNIYLIQIRGKVGFASYFRNILHALYEADRLNFIPVIELGDDCIYRENHLLLNTNNAFEYYFKQPFISLEEAYKSERVFIFKQLYLKQIAFDLKLIDNPKELWVGYKNITDEYLYLFSKLTAKYIKLNETSKKFIEDSINIEFPINWQDKKILAVHVRGTDYALHWDQHPNIVKINEYFDAIDDLLMNKNYDYIFLATDDSTILGDFQTKYGDKLLYFKDVHRSDGTLNVSFEKLDRKNDHYLNGLECLRDVYAMSFCNALVAGISHVSIMTRIINRSKDKCFEFEKIIDNGIYHKK